MKTIMTRNCFLLLKAFSILSCCYFLNIPFVTGQESTTDAFAQLIHIEHDCGKGGVLEFELDEALGPFSYYWQHGPRTPRVEGLAPGKYVFVVENMYGCKQEFVGEILRIRSCRISHTISQSNGCMVQLEVKVHSGRQLLSGESLHIEWSDGHPPVLERTIDIRKGVPLCVNISVGTPENYCCEKKKCFDIPTVPDCNLYDLETGACKIIVNEFGKSDAQKGKFIELLTVADQEKCSCDLRGYILDDNNGMLIPGNHRIHKNNLKRIGIDKGYLVFQEKDSWANVPNGSLIVIHENNGLPKTFPGEDPEDQDGDKVYIVNAANGLYFTAKKGNWNRREKVMAYGGNRNLPKWNKIDPDDNLDGIQTRYPDGRFCHGISHGENSFSARNNFELWVNRSGDGSNCKFIETDYTDKEAFACNNIVATPGLPNTAANQVVIEALQNCELPLEVGARQSPVADVPSITNKKLDTPLTVFPNPFSDQLTLSFQAPKKGRVQATLYTLDGTRVFSQKWRCDTGENHKHLKLGIPISPAVYLLEFVYPDGRKVYTQVARMK